MYEFKTLEKISIEVLHEAFVEAFSDYQVKIDLPLWKFENMIRRRGFVPGKSIGAFRDGALVGFILNGYRDWKGKPTVYDEGTGIIPECRKQGLTTSMFLKVVEQLKAEGVAQYLLEVLQQNTPAYELYKKQGFEVTRTFSCYKIDKEKYQAVGNFVVEHTRSFEAADWELLKTFWDFQPSWQNSIDSILAVPDSFTYAIVKHENRIVGYGIIDNRTGDIPQLCVERGCRRKGIGVSIMADLIKSTQADRAGVINVDDSASSLKGFLDASGFEKYVDQYEMILKL